MEASSQRQALPALGAFPKLPGNKEIHMEVEKTLKPGMDGTKRFVERFGNRLVCVRQRIDRAAGLRYTTVELVMDHRPMNMLPRPAAPGQPERLLPVRIAFKEQELRRQVRAAGGRWDTERRVWWLAADIVHRLKLKDRLA
jgi:hypothetical protein